MSLSFATILLPLLVLYLAFQWLKILKQNKSRPPGPKQLPLIGNLHQLGELPYRSLWKLSRKYGPVMFMKLGSIPCLIISSSEAAKEVLKIHDKETCSKPCLSGSRILSYNYLDMAFSPYTHHVRKTRKLCAQEVFSIKKVQSLRYLREEEVGSFIDSISESAFSSTSVDLTSKVFDISASIIFRLAFGTSFKGSSFDNEEFHEVVHEYGTIVGTFSPMDFFPRFGWLIDMFIGRAKKVRSVHQRLDSFFDNVIQAHLDPERPKQGDIIDVMLELRNDQPEADETTAWLTNDHIKAILMNMFLGGIETTAITVIWAMTSLVRNPRVMKKAQDELRNLIGPNKGVLTEEDIEQLKYLKAVIKETLRLFHLAPLLVPRKALSHFKLQNYDVNPGMLLIVNAWGIGRDPTCWQDPEEFLPERFIENCMDFIGQNFEYLPFGAGRRSCPGMNMGLAITELVLANLLYCFDWKLPSGIEDLDMGEKVALTMCKNTPLELVPLRYSALNKLS